MSNIIYSDRTLGDSYSEYILNDNTTQNTVTSVPSENFTFKFNTTLTKKQMDDFQEHLLTGMLQTANAFAYSKSYVRLMSYYLNPTKIIFSGPACICWFRDGTKIVVKKSKDDQYSEYTAVAYCIMKYVFGTNSHFKHIVEEAIQP